MSEQSTVNRRQPRVVGLDDTPVIAPEDWPERVSVANMITKGQDGSNLLLGACWMNPGQEANPWSFENSDPEVPGVTHYGPVDEVYFVIKGNLRLTWQEGSLEMGPDDAVYIAPGWSYALKNVGDDVAFFLWAMTPAPV